jgi:predicted metalloprotease with PDZ domain
MTILLKINDKTLNLFVLEPLKTLAPELILRTYKLKRSDSYDGLGICIAADAQTNLNHYIREVEPGSPGDRAGLRNNDRIISINDINVENIDFNNILILIKQGLDNDNLQFSVIHQPDHI